jgi:anti-anti-sigma factor
VAANQASLRRGAQRQPNGGSVPAAFRVATRMERGVARICPLGDVDAGTVDRIRRQIERCTAAGARLVALDLRGATFVDATGVHLVLAADAASRADGWEFRLIGGPARLQRVFDLTGSRAPLPFLSSAQLAALLTAPDAHVEPPG